MRPDGGTIGIKRESDEKSDTTAHKKQALSKRDATETAWNPDKNSILVVTKARDNRLVTFTRQLAEWLIFTQRFGREHPFIVYVDAHLKNSSHFGFNDLVQNDPAWGTNLKFWTPKLCYKHPELFHLIITLGGDGTILFSSTIFQTNVPPIMAFHLGSLGFLAPFLFTSYKNELNRLFQGDLKHTNRMRLSCTVYRYRKNPYCLMKARPGAQNGTVMAEAVSATSVTDDQNRWEIMETNWMSKAYEQAAKMDPHLVNEVHEKIMCYSTVPSESFHVLNEIVVDRGPSSNISMLELFGDERHLTTVQADGLCIATATGSTAYSLSANGSLTHPSMRCVLVTPVCPHTLSFRPMMLPGEIAIRIVVPFGARHSAYCSFDGRNRVELKQGDHIKITASPYSVKTFNACDSSNDWFSSVQSSLQWNSRSRQKSFLIVEGEANNQVEENPHSDKLFACLGSENGRSPHGYGNEDNGRSNHFELEAWTDKELEREPIKNFQFMGDTKSKM